MTVKEAIDLVNNNKCYYIEEAENLIDGKYIYYDPCSDGLEWPVTSVNIYKMEDGYVGICGVSLSETELLDPIDFKITCIAEEYEPVQTIVYKPKR